jgi:hypothetical protein
MLLTTLDESYVFVPSISEPKLETAATAAVGHGPRSVRLGGDTGP